MNDRKPSWDDAPGWAAFLCQNADGTWWWFENEPNFDDASSSWEVASIYDCCAIADKHARNSLEPRPQVELT